MRTIYEAMKATHCSISLCNKHSWCPRLRQLWQEGLKAYGNSSCNPPHSFKATRLAVEAVTGTPAKAFTTEEQWALFWFRYDA